jgi:succinate-semialdehyde dehydrogenase/glutarate-semialdehyde dehydrogenase
MQDALRIDSYNPATGEPLGSAGITPRDEVARVVAHARAAQADWGARTVRERARQLARAGTILADHADELCGLEIAEQGKPRMESYGALLNSLHLLAYFRRIAPRLLRPRRALPAFGLLRVHRIVREPLGVVGVIAPWNFPISLALEPMLAALICGNAVVLKPSEYTTQTGLLLGRLLAQALPEGLVAVVPGDATTGAALIESGIDKLVFTGSVANGRKVAALAAQHLVPVVLELGGKDAALVLEDADLARAAAGIAWGGNLNAGQACLSVERVYVVAQVADDFVARLAAEVSRLRVGAGQGDVDVAAVTTAAQLARVASQVEDAVQKGARVVCGGCAGASGRFYLPTVLAEATEDMNCMREETFGPVIAVARVRDADEAVARANASPFGLTASIWTRDLARGRALAARLVVGDASVNEHAAPAGHAEIPWGGRKASGYGKTRGEAGLLEMCALKHVSWPRLRARRQSYWYPYSPRLAGRLRGAIRFLYGSWLRPRMPPAQELLDASDRRP